jgi:hypothetical protein
MGMTAVLIAGDWLLETAHPVIDLGLVIAVGGAVYIALAIATGAADLDDLKRQLSRRRAPVEPRGGL